MRRGVRACVRTCRVNSGLTQFVAATRACDITCPPNTPRASKFKARFLDRYKLRSSCSTSRADEMSLGSASFLSVACSAIGNREVGIVSASEQSSRSLCHHARKESRVIVLHGPLIRLSQKCQCQNQKPTQGLLPHHPHLALPNIMQLIPK